MSSELKAYAETGLTLYAVLVNEAGQAWNGSTFATINGANWTDYDVAMTEAAGGIYLGNMPAAAAGAYSYPVYEQAGASPATSDDLRGIGSIEWDGSAEIAINDLSTFDPAADTVEVGSLATQAKADVNAEVVDALATDVIADSVAADGSRPTIAQALLMITRFLMEKGVVGTTVTVNKEDGTTSSMTFTLDSATAPAAITRAS